ncbi:hypothetical protein BB560_001874 [Smittium megazygosporum]|uniref:Chitin synthase n=1 Tax=Smittium megazygosporum TaxID=133381 RepID=A0A2T9ZGF0_9FUNG|nr:hypothetical protein BB560_001874 [Smittium megazygosporum]
MEINPVNSEEFIVTSDKLDTFFNNLHSDNYQDNIYTEQNPLFPNNYVILSPVPTKILQISNLEYFAESSVLRYTSCTCDPDYYVSNGYNLRQNILNRETKIFIVVTMYNENYTLFNRTYHSLVKNINYFCSRNKSRTWGKDAWKKIVICIVADGVDKINKNVLNVLGMMGVYQDLVIKESTGNRKTQAHIFEYTSQVIVSDKYELNKFSDETLPVQIIFCLKVKNKKKINSHRWFFNAFASLLNPTICVLVDVGTMPSEKSIYNLWKAFKKDTNVVGACGEISADLGRWRQKIFNPLVAIQNFEYKVSNIFDKPLESVLGYITVLPGAFSAYRYSALVEGSIEKDEGKLESNLDNSPLSVYFKGETIHSSNGTDSIFAANMYLAEDRILCYELIAKKGKKYVLKYVKNAKAYTDVPENIGELIVQRRRWLNGSLFAMTYAIFNFYKIFLTNHSFLRIIFLIFELCYQLINQLFTWFSLANWYLAFDFFTRLKVKEKDPFFGYKEYVVDLLKSVYLLCLVIVIVLSLGNNPTSSQFVYTSCTLVFAIVFLVMIYSSVYTTIQKLLVSDFSSGFDLLNDAYLRDVAVSATSIFGIHLVSSIIYGEPWHMLTCFFQYILWAPANINVLTIYALCNTHDVSWGTKGEDYTNNIDTLYLKPLKNTGDFLKRTKDPKLKAADTTKEEKFFRRTLNEDKKSDIINNCPYIKAIIVPTTRPVEYFFYSLLLEMPDDSPNDHQPQFVNRETSGRFGIKKIESQYRTDKFQNENIEFNIQNDTKKKPYSITRSGRVVPLGLKQSPFTFTKVLHQVLTCERVQEIRIAAYLDNLLILGESKKKYVENTSKIFQKLSNVDLKTKLGRHSN